MKKTGFGLLLATILLLGASGQELNETSKSLVNRSSSFTRTRVRGKAGAAGAARLRAFEQTQAMSPQPEFDAVWRSIGPRPTVVMDSAVSAGPPIASGRVTAVAVDPRQAAVAYLGSANGGVWKTVDSGRSWTPLTDDQPSLAIGSLAIDPSNPDTLYAGTGEENFDESENYFGAGVLKTEDAGKTWRLLGSADFALPVSGASGGARIGALAVHPTDRRIVLAAVQGQKGQRSGIYRSSDAGETWTNVLGGAPGTAVAFDPAQPNIVYAGLGGRSTFSKAGVYKSTDGGLNWSRSSGGIPEGIGRIALSVAESRPSTLYAAIADPASNDPLGVFKSTDGGQTWASAQGPGYCFATCWWANTIAVSPIDPDLVLVGGLQVYMTRDGGKNWLQVSQGANGNFIHWDIHAITFGPQGNRVYVGSDGGMYRADNVATAHIRDIGWNNLNDTLELTQFYPGCSGQLRETDFILCGTQDNGVQVYTGGTTWRMVAGGDGGFTVMDSSRPSIFYFSAAGDVSVYKSSPFTSFKGFLPAVGGLEKVNSDLCFLPPLAMDPAFPQRLYFGCRGLYRSNDGGGSWKKVSEGEALQDDEVYTFLAVAPGNSSLVYAATSEGKVLVSENALDDGVVLWKPTRGLPRGRAISSVAVDPGDPKTAYATLAGFNRVAESASNVFKTQDAGRSWEDISGNLPNVSANIVVPDPEQPRILFIGTDMGVFRTGDGGKTWFPVGVRLPRTPVMDIKIHSRERVLRAATHGRGMWELQLSEDLSTLPDALRLDHATAHPGMARLVGTGFTKDSVVRWNGREVPQKQVIDASTIEVPLTPADRSTVGRVTVSVLNPKTAGVSNAVDLDLAAAPVIHRVDNGAIAGPAVTSAAQPCPALQSTALAAGMVATIRGQNLAPVSVRAAASASAQTLGDAVVEFRSTTLHESYVARILSVSRTRIDFQVPLDVPLGPGLQLDVVQGTKMSPKVCVTVEKFSPGLFSVNGLGTGQAVALASDGQIAAPAAAKARPARKGELVRLSATGLGPFWQESGNNGMPIIATPQVQIGGQTAEVAAAEADKQFAGRYTVTVKVPDGAASGPNVPVQLTIGGFKTNPVTIAIQ